MHGPSITSKFWVPGSRSLAPSTPKGTVTIENVEDYVTLTQVRRIRGCTDRNSSWIGEFQLRFWRHERREPKASISFEFKNVGQKDLNLKIGRLGATTCKCTVGDLETSRSWNQARKARSQVDLDREDRGSREFSQSAQLITVTDPKNASALTLEIIVGKVVRRLRMVVPEGVDIQRRWRLAKRFEVSRVRSTTIQANEDPARGNQV